MRKRIILCLAYAFCVSAGTASGQTAAEIKERYGRPTEAYSVSDSIWMTPEFTDDGQVCRMRLYPKRVSATTNYLVDHLDQRELAKVLEQLATAATRGEKKTESFKLSRATTESSETLYSYENVSISFSSSMRGMELLPDRPDSLVFEGAEAGEARKPDEEMTVPGTAEIVTITWEGRTCANR